MAVTWGAVASGGGEGSSSATATYPTGITTSSQIFCAAFSGASTDPTPTMPAGWTRIFSEAGGPDTAYASGAGKRRLTLFKKDSTLGTESGTVLVSNTGGNTLFVIMFRLQMTAADNVLAIASQWGQDTTQDLAFSATGSSNIAFTSSDLLLTAGAMNRGSITISGTTVSAGVALTGTTQRFNNASTSGSGVRGLIVTSTIAGDGSTVATLSATPTNTTGGIGAMFVIREVQKVSTRISDTGPLRQPSGLAILEVKGQSALDGPLGAAGVVATDGTRIAKSSAPGPLGVAQVKLEHRVGLRSSAATPLSVQFVRAEHRVGVRLGVAGPLQAASVKAWNDSLLVIPQSADIVYTCDLVDGATVTRLPISSWQATIQTGASSYLQVVVPAALDYADAIAAALENENAEIVVYRGARFSDGATVESEMARAPISTATTDRGPNRYTATLSGYASAWTPDPDPPAVSARTLSKVRSISTTNKLPRVRCAIDWLLQPGLTATADDVEFTVGYINFYATSSGDAYCDVGASATA